MMINHRLYGAVLLALLLGVAGPAFWAHPMLEPAPFYLTYFSGMGFVIALFLWFATALGVLILKQVVWSLHFTAIAFLIASFVLLTLAGHAVHEIKPPIVGLVFMFSSVIGIFMHGITVLSPTRP